MKLSYHTDDTPVLTEEEISQLQKEDADTEPQNSDSSHFYDVTGFKQFEQYLAKNVKKQPKAESVISQEVLRKYAKEIKQAKLEEFRSFWISLP